MATSNELQYILTNSKDENELRASIKNLILKDEYKKKSDKLEEEVNSKTRDYIDNIEKEYTTKKRKLRGEYSSNINGDGLFSLGSIRPIHGLYQFGSGGFGVAVADKPAEPFRFDVPVARPITSFGEPKELGSAYRTN